MLLHSAPLPIASPVAMRKLKASWRTPRLFTASSSALAFGHFRMLKSATAQLTKGTRRKCAQRMHSRCQLPVRVTSFATNSPARKAGRVGASTDALQCSLKWRPDRCRLGRLFGTNGIWLETFHPRYETRQKIMRRSPSLRQTPPYREWNPSHC